MTGHLDWPVAPGRCPGISPIGGREPTGSSTASARAGREGPGPASHSSRDAPLARPRLAAEPPATRAAPTHGGVASLWSAGFMPVQQEQRHSSNVPSHPKGNPSRSGQAWLSMTGQCLGEGEGEWIGCPPEIQAPVRTAPYCRMCVVGRAPLHGSPPPPPTTLMQAVAPPATTKKKNNPPLLAAMRTSELEEDRETSVIDTQAFRKPSSPGTKLWFARPRAKTPILLACSLVRSVLDGTQELLLSACRVAGPNMRMSSVVPRRFVTPSARQRPSSTCARPPAPPSSSTQSTAATISTRLACLTTRDHRRRT
ncbi:hypothetical protein PCL_04297 [Purpureocillium lilacinum]|uniref:Uncharacterized protein n=1 Tax=Purpureocillium lilacinum TaxID=33203 RepID=A0A2U3DXZ8_PURLI|nr:hypothetical protein PCL_04297 [Purpureocillium lilacinum]